MSSQIESYFATRIYRATLKGRGSRTLNDDLRQAISVIAEEDAAGRAWSAENGYSGYTSYASLPDLTWRMPEFAQLQAFLDRHVAAFADDLEYDLGDEQLRLDSIWINVLEPGGVHSGHIHPQAVISGTYYVDVPDGARAIRFEDPRLSMMMAAPRRRRGCREENQTFVSIRPRAGMLILWESWLRHEVPLHQGDGQRISVSFNYS